MNDVTLEISEVAAEGALVKEEATEDPGIEAAIDRLMVVLKSGGVPFANMTRAEGRDIVVVIKTHFDRSRASKV